MAQLAVSGIPIILDSNDVTVQPPPPNLTRHVVFSTKVQPFLFMQENEDWEAALSNIDFEYAGAAGGAFGGAVYVNVSIVQGTRIGSTRSQILYRIPAPELPSVASHVNFSPQDRIPLTTTIDPDQRNRQIIEVALTDESGTPLQTPSSNIPTVVTIMMRRVS